MIHALKCPACSAPVDYEDQSGSRTIRCPFCNNTVLVPGAAQGGGWHPQVSVSTVSVGRGAASSAVRRALLVIPLVVVAGIVVTAVVAYKFVSQTTGQVSRTIEVRQNNVTPPPRANVEPPKPPAFATVALKFGSEGTGPGLFKDARSIAVDGEGRIYVGDYTGGRVQVFDAAGKFVTQWMVDAKMPLLDMDADRKGTVYVVQSGKIQRYEGATGKPLGEVGHERGWFNDVNVTADGGLVAAWRRQTDDIVRFDPSGRVLKTVRAAISGQTDRSELDMHVAADGLGNVYALGTFNEAVLKFTPEGRFVTKFGSSGDQPGQFRAAQSIAVDGQGRVYVSDFRGVQVFDPEGRYLDVFHPGGIAFGMTFNDRNELFVAARTQVLKLVINKKP
jgi:DNA-binding beta-propeller fold protein YncE